MFSRGDKVYILEGKHVGTTAIITGFENDQIIVEIPNVSYERSYREDAIKLVEKNVTSGVGRRKSIDKLIKEGKLCPSFPYSCTGNCDNI